MYMLLFFVILSIIYQSMIFVTLEAFLSYYYNLLSTNSELYYHDVEIQGCTGKCQR